jgi:hypothetical protein
MSIILFKPKTNSVAFVREQLYRPSDRRSLAKLVPTFADRGFCVASTTDNYGRILDFLDRSRYIFLHVAVQFYSGGWVDPVPGALLLRKIWESRESNSGSLYLYPGTLTTRPQRGSLTLFSYLYICVHIYNLQPWGHQRAASHATELA